MAGERRGKCVNIGNCSLADKREIIDVKPGADFVCTECGKGLIVAGPSGGDGIPKWAIAAGLAVLLLVAGWFAFGALTGDKKPEASQAANGEAPPPPPTDAEPLLRLGGSNTIGDKLAPALAEAWLKTRGCTGVKRETPGNDEIVLSCEVDGKPQIVTVSPHGTKTGFSGLKSGSYDIAMASDKIDDTQKTDLASLNPREHVIALDGIAVVVNPGSRVAQLTIDQVAGLFSGAITDWAQVGGAAGAVQVYARDDNSGTWKYFKTAILDNAGTTLVSSAKRFEKGSELADGVVSDANGIGFVGLTSAGAARAVALAPAGAVALFPTRFTVGREDYALSRRMYLYTAATPAKPDVARFLSFIASPEGQAVAEKQGFVPRTIEGERVREAPDVAPPGYAALTRGAMRLSTNFRFETGSADLDTKALSESDYVERFLTDNRFDPSRLMLFGFTDNKGGDGINCPLSRQRAATVAATMKSRGLQPRTVEGFCSALPVADNSSADGQARNRRVEVWIGR